MGKYKEGKGLRQEDPLSPFFFNLGIYGLGRMVDKAKERKEVEGLELGRENIEISHIQFADDIMFLVKSESHLRCLMEILNYFSHQSGLKINLENSALLGINYTDMEVIRLVSEIGCQKEWWPIVYLGVPLGGSLRKADFLEPVVVKMSSQFKRKINVDFGSPECYAHLLHVFV